MLETNYLGTLQVALEPPFDLGGTPEGTRLIINAKGGTFEGPRLSAAVQQNGGDWARIRSDGSGAVDVRGLLKTDNGELIFLRFEGRFLIPQALFADVFEGTGPNIVDQGQYYFRVAAYFETSSIEHGWLNNIVSVGVGTFSKDAVSYEFFEIL